MANLEQLSNKTIIYPSDKIVSYTLDGSIPTLTNGFQLHPKDPPIFISLVEGMVLSIAEENGEVIKIHHSPA